VWDGDTKAFLGQPVGVDQLGTALAAELVAPSLDHPGRPRRGQRRPSWQAVVGHQRGGTGFDGRTERLQVISEAAARIALLVSVLPVRRTNTGTREAAVHADGCR
jgi:hypothetical protein